MDILAILHWRVHDPNSQHLQALQKANWTSLSGHEGLVSTYPPGPSQKDTQALHSPRVRKPLLETKDF